MTTWPRSPPRTWSPASTSPLPSSRPPTPTSATPALWANNTACPSPHLPQLPSSLWSFCTPISAAPCPSPPLAAAATFSPSSTTTPPSPLPSHYTTRLMPPSSSKTPSPCWSVRPTAPSSVFALTTAASSPATTFLTSTPPRASNLRPPTPTHHNKTARPSASTAP